MQLVVVESPAKAKTIKKFLGADYTVLASMGHIRDLPSKNGSVDVANNFAMHYELSPSSAKAVKAIVDEAKRCDTILLATDPDREGEAISWHVAEVLKQKKAIKGGTVVKRVAFNEITKEAIRKAVSQPREIDMDLVGAQQVRRALDYLVGFELSPVLWRKLPGSRSAGRVQSVALRLICEREKAIEAFITEEYWSLEGHFLTHEKEALTARLVRWDNKKLEKLSITNKKEADAIKQGIEASAYHVASIEKKPVFRNPAAPFTTSTLQQEAARKLGFTAKRTMMVAQRLYEGVEINGATTGLITYMRTDGVQVAESAIHATRATIEKLYGAPYVPKAPRHYQTKAKNAQEAHEAIRPTDLSMTPDSLKSSLELDQWKLYDLVWKRMMASQMERVTLDQTTIDISNENAAIGFRATGSVIVFDGFYRLYREGKDDEEDEASKLLPAVKEKETLDLTEVATAQHWTEPPARYSEASLVKKLEELGIGRPSTYAAIISVLQDRHYVRLDKKRFIPEDRGRLVTAFLEQHFNTYVAYDFTAHLEEQLDEVSAGKTEWLHLLNHFWGPFKKAVESAKELTITQVLEELNTALAAYLFPHSKDAATHPCPECNEGSISLKLGKFGAFLGCSRYPDCRYTKQLGGDSDMMEDNAIPEDYPKKLGVTPAGNMVELCKGPYGVYVQETVPGSKEKPKRMGLPKSMTPESVNFDTACALLSLPRAVGKHPESGKAIEVGLGRYGPYVRYDGVFFSLPPSVDILTCTGDDVLPYMVKKGKAGGVAAVVIGQYDGKDITSHTGKYGPYIKWNSKNFKIPKSMNADALTENDAKEIISKE